MVTNQFNLEEIKPTEQQIKKLYEHLVGRKFNISHETLPEFNEHKNFVINHPYRAWFLINKVELVIGNIYIQYDNSIGLNCAYNISEKEIDLVLTILKENFEPLPAIPSVRVGRFFINVPAKNIELQLKLKKIGYAEHQKSFLIV